jgi:hypothetical protein
MAILDKIKLSGVTYDIIDATAVHSLDGYWTSGQTNNAITAATNALAEAIAEQHYQTSGDVQNAISGKADTTAVTQSINEAVSGKADTTAVTQSINEAVSGKANVEDAVTNLSFVKENGQNTLLFSLQKNGGWLSGEVALRVGTGLTMNDKTVEVDFTKVAKPSDIPSVTDYADAVAYDTNTKYMKFYHGGTGGTEVFSFDASPFLIDGMVQNVEIKDVEISGETVTCLVISFNTDAGKQDINIPLTDIFDASNYYTKDEVDAELSAKTDNSAFTAYTAATDTALGNKADTTAMTEAISEATSGKVDTNTYTAYTAATDTVLAGKANTGDVVTNVGATADYSSLYRKQFVIYQPKNGSDSVVGRLASGTGIEIYRGAGTYIDYVKVDTNTIQEKLTSGTNIKTVGGNSLLGSGDIAFPAGLQVQVSGSTLVFG